ncbi:hypothetical protein [Aerococcus urinaeequi]|uniref:hypothetical protein n=1 Tax=Aerococcus urinaeequi TaxID=51665 RepID=UPI003B3AC59E
MAYENLDYTHLTPEQLRTVEDIANAIRNKAYGIDVREAMARALEIVSNAISLGGGQESLQLSIRLSDLSQEVKEALTGGAVAVVGENAVGNENVKDGAVTPSKTTFFEISNNLFNPENVIRNKDFDRSGNIIDDSTFWVNTDFIPVAQGETIRLTAGYYRLATYGEDKSFISRSGTDVNGVYTLTSSSIKFMRISGTVDPNTVMMNKGDSLLPFEAFGSSLDTKYLPDLESYELFNDLKTNVGTTNTKLLNLETRVSEISENNSTSDGGNLLRVDAVKDFTFLLDIGNKEYAGHRFRKDDVEDFIKKYEESIYSEGMSVKYENYDYAHYRLPGSIEPTLVTNHYATSVGTIINHDFTGSKITLRHLVRYDGGLWKVSIDGNFVKNISTHQANTGATQVETLIADNLPEGSHTVTLEFMGIDPASPATTSDLVTPNDTPRGWITVNLGDTPEKETFKVESSGGVAKKFDITSGFSNKEFAFEVEKTKDAGSQWFPAHFGIGTTNKGNSGFQYLLLDGKEIDIDNPSSNLIPFSKAQFVQVLESKRTEDTVARAKVKLVMTVEGTKMKQSFEIEFLQDTFIRNAYVFMIPTLNTYLGQMVTDRSEKLLANTTDLGTSTFANNVNVSRIIATSNNEEMKDYYLRVDLSQDDLVINNLYLQHRDDGIHQKLYLKTHSQHEALAGEIFQVEGTWEVNRLKNANVVYG